MSARDDFELIRDACFVASTGETDNEDELDITPTAKAFANLFTPRPLREWHEDMGECLWYEFPIVEAPYVGSPLSEEWPGYHTHFTPIIPILTPEDMGEG